MPDVQLLLDAHATIGESVLWEPDTQVLYWMDVKAPALYRLDPQTLEQRSWALPDDIGGFALFAHRHAALVALRSGLYALSLDDGTLDQLAPAPFDSGLHRFNEAACDSTGRFWVGTMFDPLPGRENHAAEVGSMFTWTAAEGLQVRRDAAELHNGMAWSPDGSRFYLSHSYERRVYAFPFEAQSGRLGARELFFDLPEGPGIPDGAAVDVEGGYWCANHGGSCVQRFGSNGDLLETVPFPVSQPTMCAFGGDNLDTLYVTSASDKLSTAQLKQEPHAGGLFHFKPGVCGVPRRAHLA